MIQKPPKQGFILIGTTFITALLLLLAAYVLSFTLTELNISVSQANATQAYYLAESGVAEAIWKISNDPSWKTNFETNPTWQVNYNRNPALYPNGSYTISIVNSGQAKGTITVTGKITKGKSVAQRVIKTSVFKAIGDSPLGNVADYADGNITITASNLRVHNGGLHSNLNVIINLWSGIDVDAEVSAGNNIIKSWKSTLNAHPEIQNAPQLAMPSVSFNNPGDPNSYRSRASSTYTSAQFSDLLEHNQNLTLNGITYVTGDIDIQGGRNLTINGALVAEGDIDLGKNKFFCCWKGNCGRSDIVVNRLSSTTPSGIISRGKISMDLCMGSLNANGLIYANDQISILSLPESFSVHGGMISRKLDLASIWQGMDVYFVDDNIVYGLGNPQFAPVVTIEHWEEEY